MAIAIFVFVYVKKRIFPTSYHILNRRGMPLMRRKLLLPCLALTAAIIALYPLLSHFYFSQQAALPPGIRPRETKLLRIWLLGDMLGAESYLKQQAAAYEKAHPGRRLYLRSARLSELEDPAALLPDGVIFSPGALPQPEKVLKPLAGSWSVPDRLLMAGKWRTEQYALPFLLAGYALAEQAAGEGYEAAAGVPALLALPEKAASAELSQSKVYENFAAGRSRRAVLTLKQVRTLNARDYAFTARALPYGFTDLCLAAGAAGENAEEMLAFLQFLLTAPAQEALRDYGFFTVLPTLTLYDNTMPLMAQAEAVFQKAAALPSLFAFDPARARAMSLTETDPEAAFERLQ